MAYKVVAPYVTLKVPTRDVGGYQLVGFYAGAPVPEDIDPANLQHHLDAGLVVEENDPVAEVFATPAGTPLPGRPPNVPVAEAMMVGQPVPPISDDLLKAAEIDTGSTSASVERSAAAFEERPTGREADTRDVEQQSGSRPDGRASEARWRDYHAAQLQAQGVSEEDARAEAEGKTKAELVAQYR